MSIQYTYTYLQYEYLFLENVVLVVHAYVGLAKHFVKTIWFYELFHNLAQSKVQCMYVPVYR